MLSFELEQRYSSGRILKCMPMSVFGNRGVFASEDLPQASVSIRQDLRQLVVGRVRIFSGSIRAPNY